MVFGGIGYLTSSYFTYKRLLFIDISGKDAVWSFTADAVPKEPTEQSHGLQKIGESIQIV